MRVALARYKTLVTAAAFIGAIIAYPLLLPDSYHLGIGISAGAVAVSTVGLVLLRLRVLREVVGSLLVRRLDRDGTPILLVTAFPARDLIDEADRLHVPVLQKPFTLQRIGVVAKNTMRGRGAA